MTSNARTSSMASLDLSPTQRRFLSDISSPYHDDLHQDTQPKPTPSSQRPNRLPNIFTRFRYSIASSTASDPPNAHRHNPSFNHVHWADDATEKPTGKWTASILLLLLLLSILANLFLLFNDTPLPTTLNSRLQTQHAHSDRTYDGVLPHDGFALQQNKLTYTCYETHSETFELRYDFASTRTSYDYLWQGLQPGSEGYVYTDLNRPDNKTRRARFAMFRQLDCLVELRRAVQEAEREPRLDGTTFWSECFDYLRQTVMCNADDTVEVGVVKGEEWVVEGFGGTRLCRDPGWMYDVSRCGIGGCDGEEFYHSEEELARIVEEEKVEVGWTKGDEPSWAGLDCILNHSCMD